MAFYEPTKTIAGKVGKADTWITTVPCKIVKQDEQGMYLLCYDLDPWKFKTPFFQIPFYIVNEAQARRL